MIIARVRKAIEETETDERTKSKMQPKNIPTMQK